MDVLLGVGLIILGFILLFLAVPWIGYLLETYWEWADNKIEERKAKKYWEKHNKENIHE